jgi:hypothetical protein
MLVLRLLLPRRSLLRLLLKRSLASLLEAGHLDLFFCLSLWSSIEPFLIQFPDISSIVISFALHPWISATKHATTGLGLKTEGNKPTLYDQCIMINGISQRGFMIWRSFFLSLFSTIDRESIFLSSTISRHFIPDLEEDDALNLLDVFKYNRPDVKRKGRDRKRVFHACSHIKHTSEKNKRKEKKRDLFIHDIRIRNIQKKVNNR